MKKRTLISTTAGLAVATMLMGAGYNRIEALMWACLVFSVLIVLAVAWKLSRVFLTKSGRHGK